MDAELLNLIDRYWDLAYAEGKEGRDHDTEEGDAALCRYEIEKRIRELNHRHSGGDGEDAARLRHLLDRHLSLTPVEGGGWDIAEYSEHGIETVLFGHTDARAAIDRVMQYHGQTEDAARAGERG